jgi:hypothetical protein
MFLQSPIKNPIPSPQMPISTKITKLILYGCYLLGNKLSNVEQYLITK